MNVVMTIDDDREVRSPDAARIASEIRQAARDRKGQIELRDDDDATIRAVADRSGRFTVLLNSDGELARATPLRISNCGEGFQTLAPKLEAADTTNILQRFADGGQTDEGLTVYWETLTSEADHSVEAPPQPDALIDHDDGEIVISYALIANIAGALLLVVATLVGLSGNWANSFWIYGGVAIALAPVLRRRGYNSV